jgi:hypothetical protein
LTLKVATFMGSASGCVTSGTTDQELERSGEDSN